MCGGWGWFDIWSEKEKQVGVSGGWTGFYDRNRSVFIIFFSMGFFFGVEITTDALTYQSLASECWRLSYWSNHQVERKFQICKVDATFSKIAKIYCLSKPKLGQKCFDSVIYF